ncbi:hypothetical protein ACWD6R_16550 [Streptomyces sp. NPDC005151]
MADTLAVLAGRIATLERLVRDLSRTSRLAHSSIESGAISVYDDGGILRGSIGLQQDGTVALAAVNGPPPPIPSAPSITSVLGGVAVSWSGAFADGSQAPADFAYVEVHFSSALDFPDDGSLFSAFYSPSGGTMTVPSSGPLWVRLVCVSTSGAVSGPSAAAGPAGPAPVVAQAVLDGIINDLALADNAVTRAKIAAGAVGKVEIADGSITTPKLVVGELNGDRLAAGTVAADALVAASVTAKHVKALSLTGDRMAVNTLTADNFVTGTITAASGVISSIDAAKITVGKIAASQIDATNLVVSAANVNGTVGSASTATSAVSATTVTGSIGAGVTLPPAQIGSGQIPQTTTINGGSVQTGTLDAATIKAGTISVDRLAVGLAGQVGQKFYDFGDSATKWSKSGPGTMTTVAAADGMSGGSVMRCVGYVAAGYRPDIKIPFDPGVTYRVSARVRQTVANGTPGANQKFYAGVAGIAADGVTWVNLTGQNATSNQFNFAASAQDLTAGAGFVTYTGYIKGTSAAPVGGAKPNANAPGQLHANVRYITPIVHVNYTSGTGTAEIDMFAIEVVEMGALTASNIIAGAINGQTITGATLQTAATGQRVVITPSGTPGTNSVRFYSGTAAETEPGEILATVDSKSGHERPRLNLWSPTVETGTSAELALIAGGGTQNDQGEFRLSTGDGSGSTTSLYAYAADGGSNLGQLSVTIEQPGITPNELGDLTITADTFDWTDARNKGFSYSSTTGLPTGLSVVGDTTTSGNLTAGNIRAGRVTITPTAANVPTSVTITGLAMTGGTPRAVATASTTVPGTSVLGVGCTNVTNNSVTVWLTRNGTTGTAVDYMLIGS